MNEHCSVCFCNQILNDVCILNRRFNMKCYVFAVGKYFTVIWRFCGVLLEVADVSGEPNAYFFGVEVDLSIGRLPQ